MKTIFAFLLLCLLAVRLEATTHYVSNSGNDSAAGSVGAPWLTLHLSIPKLSAGDTLVITGTFAETDGTGNGYSFSVAGTTNNPISLVGSNGIIDVQTGGDGGNYVFTGNFITIDGLQVTSSLAGGVHYGGAFEMDGQFGVVKNCTFHDMYGSLSSGTGDKLYCVVNHGSYNTYSNLLFRGIQDGDIFRVWGHFNLITHCAITNCTNPNYISAGIHADLIQFWGPEQSFSNVLECSVFASNSISGGALSSDNPATHTGCTNMNGWVYRNNIFANNGSQFIQCAADGIRFENNTFYNWPSGGIDFWPVYFNNFTVENNVFINSGMQYGLGYPTSSMTMASNAWDAASYSNTAGNPDGSSIISAYSSKFMLITNAGFTNPTNFQFTLLSGSVLRGAGLNLTPFFTNDFGGSVRPSSGAWDIGAYEYAATVIATFAFRPFTFTDIPFLAQGASASSSVIVTNPPPPIPSIVFIPEDESSTPSNLLTGRALIRARVLTNNGVVRVYVFDGLPNRNGWHSTSDELHYVTNYAPTISSHGLNDVATDGKTNFVWAGNGEIWTSAGSDTNLVSRFPFTNLVYFTSVVYQTVPGLWIVGGIGVYTLGISATSSDMTNWTITHVVGAINDLATSGTNTAAAAVGSIYGMLLTTVNGTAWTGTTTSDTTNAPLAVPLTIVWDGDEFCSLGAAYGQGGTNCWQAVGNNSTWSELLYQQTVGGQIMYPEGNGLACYHNLPYHYKQACAAYTDVNYSQGYASYQAAPDVPSYSIWQTPDIVQTQRVTTNFCISATWFKDRFVVTTRPVH